MPDHDPEIALLVKQAVLNKIMVAATDEITKLKREIAESRKRLGLDDFSPLVPMKVWKKEEDCFNNKV